MLWGAGSMCCCASLLPSPTNSLHAWVILKQSISTAFLSTLYTEHVLFFGCTGMFPTSPESISHAWCFDPLKCFIDFTLLYVYHPCPTDHIGCPLELVDHGVIIESSKRWAIKVGNFVSNQRSREASTQQGSNRSPIGHLRIEKVSLLKQIDLELN